MKKPHSLREGLSALLDQFQINFDLDGDYLSNEKWSVPLEHFLIDWVILISVRSKSKFMLIPTLLRTVVICYQQLHRVDNLPRVSM